MNKRMLGKTGIEVSEIGIGTWELSGDVWGKKDSDVSKRAVLEGVDAGATLIDTAAGYGAGFVESLIGELFSAGVLDRSSIVLTTKIKPENGIFAPPPEIGIADAYSPDWITAKVEESLSRLKTDYIDILFMHTWNKAWAAETVWYETCNTLKQRGLVRAIGISVPDEGASDANVHIATGHIDVIQTVYNVFQQEPEYTLFPICLEHEVGIIARSPFSSGAISQKWEKNHCFEEGDWRGLWPLEVKPGWLEDQASMGSVIQSLFDEHKVSWTTGALKYVLNSHAVSCVIPGSANPDHVKTNISVSDKSDISSELKSEIKKLWLDRTIHGTYNGSV